MKTTCISIWLLAAICLFFGASARSETLNEILNQVSSDLEKKKESSPTNSPATQQTRQPAQSESRSSNESKAQSSKPKSKAATVQPKQSDGGGTSLRPSSKSRFVTTRDLKKLVGQQVNDTWFSGDFVASSISGNTVVMYPIWAGGFVRGYSTEIRATFRNGIPSFPGRGRLPMDPIDSTAGIHIDQAQPLRITSVTRSVKPGTFAEIVVVRAEQ